jgi:TRAP-type uncharacterized transport system substrate-binding protein
MRGGGADINLLPCLEQPTMDRNLLLRRVAVVFGATCLILAGWYYLTAPQTFRVAVGPEGSPQHRYLQAMARALREAQKPFRLELVTVPGSAAAGALLDGRKVDLAVLRSDNNTSLEARSLAVLEKRSLVIVTRKDSGIASISDLKGRTTAILEPGFDPNLPIIERILAHYGIRTPAANVQELNARDFAQAPKTYDAYIVIADPASGAAKEAIDAIMKREEADLDFVAVPAPDGLTMRLREVQKVSVPEGAFGGSPPSPSETLETVALTYELTASSNISQADGTALLTALIDLRTRMRRLVPSHALDVEPPPVDQPRRFLPHVGAAAYVNDDEAQTFLETYSDQIWLGLFILSIAGSSVTGFLAWSGFFDAPHSRRAIHGRVSSLARRLCAADEAIDLDAAQGEIDEIVVGILKDYGRPGLTAENELCLALWTTALSGIIERRRALAELLPAQRS